MTDREEKFTPGPWKVGVSANSRHDMMNYYVFAEREPDPKHPFAPELFICRTDSTVVERDADEKQGNAALIAAAPEMYEALQTLKSAMLDALDCADLPDDVLTAADEALEKAEKALKKARGEE